MLNIAVNLVGDSEFYHQDFWEIPNLLRLTDTDVHLYIYLT